MAVKQAAALFSRGASYLFSELPWPPDSKTIRQLVALRSRQLVKSLWNATSGKAVAVYLLLWSRP